MYFVFDLDATLADMSAPYHFISSLRLPFTKILPVNLAKELDAAYKLFVERILQKEPSLGILRPGILTIMEKLESLKKRGYLTTVIIYSNNSHLPSLEFVRDLINKHVGSKLISECIHWEHPIRNNEKELYPGMYPKTWNTLSRIIGQRVTKKDVFFFDDLKHPDLYSALKENYYKVPPYKFHAPVAEIADIFKSAIKDAHISIPQFAVELFDILNIKNYFKSLTYIITILQDLSYYGIVKPRTYDHGIVMMNQAIERARINGIKNAKRRGHTLKKRYYVQK